MRRFNILFAFAAILLSSCINDEVDYIGYQPSSKGGIHIVGAVEDYDIKSVGTRADDGDIADSYISEMTMFIFKKKGDSSELCELIQGYTDVNCTPGNECTSAINIQRGNPTFLIDTEEGILADLSGTSDTSVVYYDNDANDLGACDIYIVANAWHQLSAGEVGSRPVDAIKTLADLEAFVLDIDASLAMPMIDEAHHRGFPMIGKQQGGSFKLKKGADNEGNAVATIPLKKLYSKVRFTMQINADQVVAGQTPKFTISKVEVFNVPKKARLGRKLKDDGSLNYDIDYLKEIADIESTSTPSDYYYYVSSDAEPKPFVINSFNKTTIYHSTSLTTDDIIEFGFYMPEHKVTPNTITYPANITDEAKQYYKPAGVGQSRNGDGSISAAKIATFVRIHGSYTDHNGQILGVTYDIYLGQNNSDDFTVKRNQLLNNKLIITGLTNHKNAYPDAEGNISIDHRVEVSDRGFNLSMERTAILDAHFEVRPLDIELSPNSQMVITIPEKYRSWIAMENDAVAYGNTSGLYVNTTTARKGVRKYFTTNLVSELNTALQPDNTKDVSITISNNESGANTTKTFRIWFYIDENPNVYDKTGATTPNSDADGEYTVSKEQYRVCPVKFKYMGTDKDGNTMTKDEKINFQQWNLWRVWSADGKRYYDIEYEEEYLNNYASDMQYGQTQDGMEYGLDGVQLSKKYPSIALGQSTGVAGWFNQEDAYTEAFMQLDDAPYYDFYLATDITKISGLAKTEKLTVRNYSGLSFNEEIATTLKGNYAAQQTEHNKEKGYLAQIEKLNLTQSPSSAFAYCYHKNKRNDKGEVVEQKWFLPSIDEIEDIAVGAYDEFNKVFQNKFYWSCQPSYDPIEVALSVTWTLLGSGTSFGTTSATYYLDNQQRARSTSVYFDGFDDNGKAVYKPSSSFDGGTIRKYTGIVKASILSGNKVTIDDGYEDLSSSVSFDNVSGNKLRTESCRIRAVYRSGTK